MREGEKRREAGRGKERGGGRERQKEIWIYYKDLLHMTVDAGKSESCRKATSWKLSQELVLVLRSRELESLLLPGNLSFCSYGLQLI